MKRTRPYSSTKSPKSKQSKTYKNNKLTMYKQPANNNVRLVKRHADFGQLVINPITGATGAYTFRLNQVAGYTELTAMYDRYKINAVEVTFFPKVNGVHTLTLVDTPDPYRLLTCIDYTDATPPANAAEVREYETCEVTCVYEKHIRYVSYPKIVDNVSSTRSSYISTASASTAHYGLKYYHEPTANTGSGLMTYNVECVFYMTFKDLK